MKRSGNLLVAGAVGLCAMAGQAWAQHGNVVWLQYFESEWDDIERRAPDLFLAGYGAVWLPPPSIASDPYSAGYDVFDRFDLGKPPLTDLSPSRKRTAFGTEATFGAMVDELQRANVLVYVDAILNHNSARTTSDAFLADGGWPGFYIPRENPPRDKLPTDDWGDFHGGNGFGFLQSENPGGGQYSLHDGDLVGLIDINQSSNLQFIRQPVDANPSNIPAGNIRNLPDPDNVRFYPDQVLTPDAFTNPATAHKSATSVTRFKFNTADPSRGDEITENATAYLARWVQWMLEVQGVDGFRLDAHKHVEPWWWDTYYDSAVFLNRTRPDGQKVTPLSFGENVTGNFDILANYYRKDGFGNRDSLDLGGAGKVRDLIGAAGFGSWDNLFDAGGGHLDVADDGFNNGSAGLFHVFSHDNGTVGDGTSLPSLPTIKQQGLFAHAYMLTRPGRSIVYHNARGIFRSNGFFPREGVPLALGLDPQTNSLDNSITELVRLHNQYAWGQYFPLNGGGSAIDDVLVYERAIPFGAGLDANLLVGVNDRYDAGLDTRTVTTSFPAGTRLQELTGNAADPMVDEFSLIPEVIVVGAGGQVTIVVPRNASGLGEHNKGYVLYGPAVPDGSLTLTPQAGVIPADPSNVPAFFRRLNDIPIVTADTFQINLDTQLLDPLDPTADDNAIFRIDAGAEDWNGSGSVDIPLGTLVTGGYEQFVTLRQPGVGEGDLMGHYAQDIDATRLDEGFHYISVLAFRQRPAGTTPLFRDFREVVYIDRELPSVQLVEEGQTFTELRPEMSVTADRTVTAVHTFLNLPMGSDPVALADIFNAANRYDRFEYRRIGDVDLVHGPNTVTVVAFEHSGSVAVEEFTVFGDFCAADLASPFGALDFFDLLEFLSLFDAQDPAADLAAPFGAWDFFDILEYLALFDAGC